MPSTRPKPKVLHRARQTFGTLYRNWQARRSVRKLRDLDDHMLHDMGLTRTDVDLASHQPLTRNPTLFLETRMRG